MKPNPFLLVLGVHRSGTSALAGVIDRMGFNSGGDVLAAQPDNPKGFWENIEVVNFHDEMLEKLGSSWDDPLTLHFDEHDAITKKRYQDRLEVMLAEGFGSVDRPYVKDPRLCQFVEFWLPVLKKLKWGARCLIIVRNPYEVAESLRKRNNIELDSALLLWMKSNLNVEYQTRNMPRSFISYDSLLADPAKEIRRALMLLGYDGFNAGVIEGAVEYIDKGERHNYQIEPEFPESSIYSELSQDVYNSLLALTEKPGETEVGILNQSRALLNSHESLSRTWIQSRKRVLDSAVSSVKEGIEHGYELVLNKSIDAEVQGGDCNGVSDSLAMIDIFINATSLKIIDIERRAKDDLEACMSKLNDYETKPLSMFIRLVIKKIAQKFKRKSQ